MSTKVDLLWPLWGKLLTSQSANSLDESLHKLLICYDTKNVERFMTSNILNDEQDFLLHCTQGAVGEHASNFGLLCRIKLSDVQLQPVWKTHWYT